MVVDKILYAASAAGDHSLVWLLIAALGALRGARARRSALRLGIALALESAVVNGPVKLLFRRSRPAWEGQRPHGLRRPRTTSFPSGHASSAAFALVMLAEDHPWWPLYLPLATAVAASRVHVRIHHGSDVAGGVVVGLALGWLGRRLAPLPRAEPAESPTATGR